MGPIVYPSTTGVKITMHPHVDHLTLKTQIYVKIALFGSLIPVIQSMVASFILAIDVQEVT